MYNGRMFNIQVSNRGDILKALVIVDMQEDYIGEKSKYKFSNKQELIQHINHRIREVEKDTTIIYLKNSRKGFSSNLVKNLYIATNLIFIKEKSSGFSSDDFVKYISTSDMIELEIIGIDGNCCVKNTAIDAIKKNLIVTINLSCVGFINQERFLRTKQELKTKQVRIMN